MRVDRYVLVRAFVGLWFAAAVLGLAFSVWFWTGNCYAFTINLHNVDAAETGILIFRCDWTP